VLYRATIGVPYAVALVAGCAQLRPSRSVAKASAVSAPALERDRGLKAAANRDVGEGM
jgi:hypothetical protein